MPNFSYTYLGKNYSNSALSSLNLIRFKEIPPKGNFLFPSEPITPFLVRVVGSEGNKKTYSNIINY